MTEYLGILSLTEDIGNIFKNLGTTVKNLSANLKGFY